MMYRVKLIPETIDDNEDKFRNLVISTSGIKSHTSKKNTDYC